MIFSIAYDKLHLHYFDHSGLVISRPTSITTKYDPTMHMCDPVCKDAHPNLRENAIGWIENHDGAHLSIMGDSNGLEYALKDCWVAEDRKNHEARVLRLVEEVLNVVRLIANWDVLYDGKPDCMQCIRASHGIHSSAFICRFHHHLLLSPCGDPLLSYSSKPELLRAFHNFVRAHELMLQKNILHGDLSPNNFIIHNGQGYFIDFDHARIIAPGTNSVPSEGMALYVNPSSQGCCWNSPHTGSDDLESLCYIFVEFATTFDGPHGVMKDGDRRPMWVEYFEKLGCEIWTTKQAYVLAPIKDTSLIDKTTQFFQTFNGIIQEWHHLILAAASSKTIGVTHTALMVLLEIWISQLLPDAPEAIVVPMASSLRLGHPPPDDTQSSAGPCRSMRIQQRVP
ncbi:kinase-like domain-containing protein [Suillus lakei]|nr:kinase-like domain-containing protein [Suillus lakei]